MSLEIALPRSCPPPLVGAVTPTDTVWHPLLKSAVFVMALSAPWAGGIALVSLLAP